MGVKEACARRQDPAAKHNKKDKQSANPCTGLGATDMFTR